MPSVRPILLALVLVTPLFSQPEPAPDAGTGPLPIRRVVLYKHGVGSFERAGTIDGTDEVRLDFKAAQMKDVLKSLYAVDLSGGRIATIAYDTKDPLSKQLEDILIEVPEQQALTVFLAQLKGAPVSVDVQGEKVTGRVLGVEPVDVQTKGEKIAGAKLVLYADDGRVIPVDLLEASSVTLQDPGLQADLQRMMAILTRAQHADRKTVTLHATGEGTREIRVGYIVETPIWKTSYRVLFSEGREPLLQGWAIIENTTNEDWNDVDVTFIAGSPVSFIMDLYTAYYPRRTEIGVGLVEAPAPQPRAAGRGPDEAARSPARKLLERFDDRNQQGAAQALDEVLEEGLASAAEGAAVGELFAYHVSEPVSVARGQAALVPIISARVTETARVLHFGPDRDRHPMNAWRLVNRTDLTLESGPVTFFDGSTCIGESLLPRVLKPGMNDILDYAVEAGVEITRKADRRDEPVTQASIANGILTLVHTENRLTEYVIRSSLPTVRALYLDHPMSPGFSLAEPAKPDEMDGDRARFRLDLEPNATRTVTVRESRRASTTLALLQTGAEVIRFHLSQPYLSDAARRFLSEVAELQSRIGALASREADIQKELQRLAEDQARVRENVQVLRSSPRELDLRARYLTRLEEADQRMDVLRRELTELRATIEATQRTLAAKVLEFKDA